MSSKQYFLSKKITALKLNLKAVMLIKLENISLLFNLQ